MKFNVSRWVAQSITGIRQCIDSGYSIDELEDVVGNRTADAPSLNARRSVTCVLWAVFSLLRTTHCEVCRAETHLTYDTFDPPTFGPPTFGNLTTASTLRSLEVKTNQRVDMGGKQSVLYTQGPPLVSLDYVS